MDSHPIESAVKLDIDTEYFIDRPQYLVHKWAYLDTMHNSSTFIFFFYLFLFNFSDSGWEKNVHIRRQEMKKFHRAINIGKFWRQLNKA